MRCQTCNDTKFIWVERTTPPTSLADAVGPRSSDEKYAPCQDCLGIHPNTDSVTPEMIKVARSYLPDAWALDLERAIAAALEVRDAGDTP
jgi:hypothetical protein